MAAHVAASGPHAAVAYRDTGGALTVLVVDRTLGLWHLPTVTLASGEVPGSAIPADGAMAGPIDLAAHADGTFAVVWTRTGGEYPEGAVQRFRVVCE